ncbi:MAG: hypothetical protein ACTSWA_10740, partial [Candidatus Thorarchaeota archaeon]
FEEPVEEEPIAGAPIISKEDQHVLPSEIASKQVEPEVDKPEVSAVIEETPLPEEDSFEPVEVKEEVEHPASEPMTDEEGRAVVKDILEKVRAAEARTKDEDSIEPPDTDIEPPPAEPEVELEVEKLSVEGLEPPEPEVIAFEEPSQVASPSPPAESAEVSTQSVETTDVPVRDEKIRELESDIKSFNIESEQLKSELDKLHSRLDEEVERCLVVSETKRTLAESIERELNLAKKEYDEASKEYKTAENRRKKELSNAEKRLREVEKRIKKAEENRDKRIREIEKERRKREEEARSD